MGEREDSRRIQREENAREVERELSRRGQRDQA